MAACPKTIITIKPVRLSWQKMRWEQRTGAAPGDTQGPPRQQCVSSRSLRSLQPRIQELAKQTPLGYCKVILVILGMSVINRDAFHCLLILLSLVKWIYEPCVTFSLSSRIFPLSFYQDESYSQKGEISSQNWDFINQQLLLGFFPNFLHGSSCLRLGSLPVAS